MVAMVALATAYGRADRLAHRGNRCATAEARELVRAGARCETPLRSPFGAHRSLISVESAPRRTLDGAMRTIETLPPTDGSVRAEVLALVATAHDLRGAAPLSDNKMIALEHGRSGSIGIVAREDGQIAGYAHLTKTDEGFACEIVTTAVANDDDELTAALAAGVVDAVANRGGGRLDYFLPNPVEHAEAAARALGFAPTRELLVLRRQNSPSTVERAATPAVVPFRVGVDEEAWLTLNARAFATHPEQGRWTRADLEDRETEPWFEAAGLLCCWIDGRLAATCWTKRHDGDDPVGEIYVMSVDPDFQGTGLGRHVLAHGLAHITDAGLPATILYVEGDNDPALGLYRSYGFAPASRTVVLSRQVPAR